MEKVHIDDVYSHILEARSRIVDDRRLGYVNQKTNSVDLVLPMSQIDLHIRQSVTGLSDSTGFVCWRAAQHFVDWLISSRMCPFVLSSQDAVVELGSGVGAVSVSVLAPLVSTYIATDQPQLLKLLKENYSENKHCYSSKEAKAYFEEFDWEDPEAGSVRVKRILNNHPVDYVLATDTVYNEYLIEPFIDSFLALMGAQTKVIIAIYLRDE